MLLKWRHSAGRIITLGITPHTALRLYMKRRSQTVKLIFNMKGSCSKSINNVNGSLKMTQETTSLLDVWLPH
jgi:hypothetical protein